MGMVWLVRSPEGRVIGASVTAAGAVRDVKSHCGATTGSAMNDLSQIVYDNLHTENYEHNGYTLTRTPLPAAAPVVVLDEWRVSYANGSTTFSYFSPHEAAKRAAKDNETFEDCGARVMRVALVEVPADA